MIKIGLTKSEIAFHNYPQWVLHGRDDIELIILDYEKNNLKDLHKCDGLILSGGVDIHPSYYKEERLTYPYAPKFDKQRDAFEEEAVLTAFLKIIPILGICRGMQLMNVALGGSLIQDLEESGKVNHRKDQENDRIHGVTIDQKSKLYEIAKMDNGKVNSAHHQGIHDLSAVLKGVALSEDGVIEAVELENNPDFPFFLGVQWHPERFFHDTYTKPFSTDIKNSFFNACSIK
jgi:putative glutamine amidotransferase